MVLVIDICDSFTDNLVQSPGGPGARVLVRRNDGLVMGLRHWPWPLRGVPFHPEPVRTHEGRQIRRNSLEMAA